jgi:hypothetical protein
MGRMFLHALWRSVLLVFLGIFLRSLSAPITNYTFEDTLTQIGLGYPILFLLGFAKPRWQWTAFGGILFAYWLAWALYPLPGPGFDWRAVGVPSGFPLYTGFAAHWNKNANLGQAFDVWFLNLFPRVKPFLYNGGGYLTLSFIPTLGTMILGLVAGRWLRAVAPKIPLQRMFYAGLIGVAAGLDARERRRLLPLPRRLLLPDRGEGVAQMGLPAGGDRHELDCGLPDGAPDGRLHRPLLQDPSGGACLRLCGRRPRAAHGRHRGPASLLADPALDVPAEPVPEDLSGAARKRPQRVLTTTIDLQKQRQAGCDNSHCRAETREISPFRTTSH